MYGFIFYTSYTEVYLRLRSMANRTVESMGNIISRTSLLDLDVQFSLHLAPETISFCFCSCECSRDKIHVLLPDCRDSNYYDFHQHDEDVLFRFL